jgi:hypothetical protein
MTTPALDSLLEAIRAIPSLAARLSALDNAYEALRYERDAQMHAWGVVAHREAVRAAIDRWKTQPVTMFPDEFDGESWVFPVLPPEHFAAIEALWRDTVIDEFALYLRRDDCDVLTGMRGSVRGAPVDFGWSYAGGDRGAGGNSSVMFGVRPGSRRAGGPEGFLEAARALAGDLPVPLMCAYLYLIAYDHITPGESFHTPQFWLDSELRELAVAWNAQHGVVAPFG